MRRLLSSVALIGLLTAQQAQAQAELQCLSPQEREAVAVAALRSELMVLATGCHDDDGYNAFIRKFQPDLVSNENAIGEIFKHKYGRRAQQEHDQFTTELANGESSAGMRLGSDFCQHNGMIFNEVMALRGPNELASYAAGKDLVPATTAICPAPAPAQHVAQKTATVKHN
jgi:hypothetical protein